MTPMTISPVVALGSLARAHGPKISTPLSVIAWLSMAATALSLLFAVVLSLIIWSVAG
jgi:hypothetical protein